MVFEIAIIASFCALYWYNFIRIYTLLTLILTMYWLPKWLFLDIFMDIFYPSIITRKRIFQHDGKYIALTFDDAPYGAHEEIIKILDMYNMKGTFFVISDYVNNSNIHILVNAVKNGHQLANHGKTNFMHAVLPMKSLIKEIAICDLLIADIYREANVDLPLQMFYRPGSGLFTNKMLKHVESIGYKLALGSVYPNDPTMRNSFINYHYITNHLENGDVVIIHDRNWTVPLLKKLLPYLNENGYHPVTLNELFH